MFYINENILFKTVSLERFPDDCKLVLTKLSIKTRKKLCIDHFKSPSQNDYYFLDNLLLILSKLICKYDNVVLMGDLNFTVEIKNLEVFMSTCDLECMIRKTYTLRICSS